MYVSNTYSLVVGTIYYRMAHVSLTLEALNIFIKNMETKGFLSI